MESARPSENPFTGNINTELPWIIKLLSTQAAIAQRGNRAHSHERDTDEGSERTGHIRKEHKKVDERSNRFQPARATDCCDNYSHGSSVNGYCE